MLCGSILFHGALVGTAALWARSPARIDPLPGTTEIGIQDEGTPGPDIGSSEPLPPPAPSEPAAPVVQNSELVDDIPPTIDQDITDPSTPRPPSPIRSTPTKKILTPSRTTAASSSQSTGLSIHSGTSLGNSGNGAPGNSASAIGWRMPKPPYPYALRSQRIQGVAKLRITTDSTGRVSDVVILRSTGNSSLDANTIERVRAEWSGPPNTSTIREVEYKLQ